MLGPVVVNPVLENLHLAGFFLKSLVHKEKYVGIAEVDGRRQWQKGLSLIGPVLKNCQSRANNPVAFGRIKECRVDYTVGNGTDTYFGSGVDAYDFNFISAEPPGDFRGTDCHAVVVGIYQIDIVINLKQRIDNQLGIFLSPVGSDTCQHRSAMRLKLFHKALVPVFGRR